MRLTTGSMLQVARDIRVDDHAAADRRRQTDAARDESSGDAATARRAVTTKRPSRLRGLISLGLHA